MDIKDIKRAMDNMPMGDGSAFAEISVGPAKHEQFLDEHYGKVALVVLLCVLGAAGWIIYNGMQDSMERKAGAALVAAMGSHVLRLRHHVPGGYCPGQKGQCRRWRLLP